MWKLTEYYMRNINLGSSDIKKIEIFSAVIIIIRQL